MKRDLATPARRGEFFFIAARVPSPNRSVTQVSKSSLSKDCA